MCIAHSANTTDLERMTDLVSVTNAMSQHTNLALPLFAYGS